MKAVQLRGNCQCCGRQQAVNGRMAKHGYTVDNGWFNGVCQGANHKPMQEDRSVTDKIVSDIRDQVASLLQRAADLKSGKVTPETCKAGTAHYEGIKRVDDMVPFAQGKSHYQDEAVRTAIYQAEQRARMGTSFAKDLEDVANGVHGKPLVQVKKADAPARILAGQQKILGNGKVATVKYQDGARVYWTYTNSEGKEFNSWTGTTAWRKLTNVEVK